MPLSYLVIAFVILTGTKLLNLPDGRHKVIQRITQGTHKGYELFKS